MNLTMLTNRLAGNISVDDDVANTPVAIMLVTFLFSLKVLLPTLLMLRWCGPKHVQWRNDGETDNWTITGRTVD